MDNEQMKTNGGADAVPTFTPPTPTFTPPVDAKPTFNGPACYYHKDEPAVAKCARCGKFICQDCFDNYGVSAATMQVKLFAMTAVSNWLLQTLMN